MYIFMFHFLYILIVTFTILNKYEQYNVNYIVEYEVSKGYRNPPQETVHKVSDVNALLYGNGDMENKKVSVPGRMIGTDDGYILCYEENDYGVYLCDLDDYDVELIVSSGGYCTVTGLFYYDDHGNPFIDVDDIDFECN